MKTLKFTKMHSLGNDFIVVNAVTRPFDLDAQTIQALGDRHTGIGFDQLLVIDAPSEAGVDFDYRIFNADGSEVEHCGNGARCFAMFAIKQGLTNKEQLHVKVKKGTIDISYQDEDHIEVDMGVPILAPKDIPFAVDGERLSNEDSNQVQYQLQLHGESIPASVISVGNPHVVFMVSDVWNLKIADMGKMVQQSSYFPESVNVNFVERVDETTLHLRTYERGVGETLACGTGACASAFCVHQLGVIDDTVTVKTNGGNLSIRLVKGRIYLSGSAREVFTGELTLAE